MLASATVAIPPPVPDTALDCAFRQLFLTTSIARLPWSTDVSSRVSAALQLETCPPAGPPSLVKKLHSASPPLLRRTPADFFVSSTRGNDSTNDGKSIDFPLRTLIAARTAIRSIARDSTSQRLIVDIDGIHYLETPLMLDDKSDSFVTWRASLENGGAIISGGIPLNGLEWVPSSVYPSPVIEAVLPPNVPLDFTSLFDATTERRLPLAREPNGDAENDMQPKGYALVRGNINGTLTPPKPVSVMSHVEIGPPRNLTSFPIWGRDFDPRNPGIGYVWYGENGGGASWFENERSFWANKTIEAGAIWNATGGVDPHSGLPASPFNASGWASSQTGRRAHIFHDSLWGNWIYDVDQIDTVSETMTFSRGGWQEGRGGGMRTQPFFIEGAKEALDAPGEWFVDASTRKLHLWPNQTYPPTNPNPNLVAVAVENIVTIRDTATGVHFEGISFTQTSDGLMEQYTVSAAGDWSNRRAAAVTVDSAAKISFMNCTWNRVGGNGLLITGSATDTLVDSCDFYKPGGSGIVVIGYVARANVSDESTATPARVLISKSIFEGIGVYGKQTSALFIGLADNVTMTECVLFSGPRAGININDGHGGGHNIERNVIFDWVRETQDHSPINSWDRENYVNSDGSLHAGWSFFSNNAIMNGPSPNRDLGNLFPCIDNDDGSQKYFISGNVCVYGGFKNYLGQNKKWVNNLITYPDRFSGDACLTQWGGEEHTYANNTCITKNNQPQYSTSSVMGDQCIFNYSDATTSAFLPLTHNNIYMTPDGTFSQGCDTLYDLTQLQSIGAEIDSTVQRGYIISDIINQAQTLLA